MKTPNYLIHGLLQVLILCTFSVGSIIAQSRKNDRIVKRDSSLIEGVILTVGDQVIQYKKASDPQGPVFHVLKSDIARVMYGNGETETFKIQPPLPGSPGNVILYPMNPWIQSGFTDDLKPWRSEDLKSAYTFYNSKAKASRTAAIVAGSIGAAATIAGIILVSGAKEIKNANGYYYEDYEKKQLGTGLIVAGLVAGTTVGTIGLIRTAVYRRKAKLVNDELIIRKETLGQLGIQPTFDPGTRNVSLSFSLRF